MIKTQKDLWECAMARDVLPTTQVPEDTIVRMVTWFENYRNKPIKRVLEIGCGHGNITQWLVSKNYKDIIAFDFAKNCVNITKGRLQNATNLIVYQHDILEGIPDEWGHFDLIIEANVFQHISYKKMPNIFNWIYDRLNLNGALIGMMLDRNMTIYPWYLSRNCKVKGEDGSLILKGKGRSGLENIGYTHFFTDEEIKKLATKFKTIEIMKYSITLPSFEVAKRIPGFDGEYCRKLLVPILIK